MGLAQLLTQEVVVVRRSQGATQDEYGNPITSTQSLRDRWPARLEQVSGVEVAVGDDRVLTDWVCYLPPETVVDPSDRIEYGGRTFEVVGPPQVLMRAQGPGHLEARLRFVQGGG